MTFVIDEGVILIFLVIFFGFWLATILDTIEEKLDLLLERQKAKT